MVHSNKYVLILLLVIAVEVVHLYVADRRLLLASDDLSLVFLSFSGDAKHEHEAEAEPVAALGAKVPKKERAIPLAEAKKEERIEKERPAGVDANAPPIIHGVTHLLPSIPSKNRIPPHGLRNTTAHFQNWSAGTSPDALFVYNPSIIALPNTTLADLTVEEGTLEGNGGARPVYLASYRLSSVHSCGFPTYPFWLKPRNLFGFALLDANLELVPRSDVVIDLNAYFGKRANFEDLRLFEFDGKIYISSYEKLVPIGISFPAKGKGGRKRKTLPNLFGNGLVLSLLGGVLSIDCKGKNFQFFRSGLEGGEKRKSGKVLVEAWPAMPRVVLEVDLESSDATSDRWGGLVIPTIDENKASYLPEVKSSLNATLRQKFFKRDRGTACCVRIDNVHFRDLVSSKEIRNLDYVLVGVAHTKSRGRMPSSQGDRFNYLSRLYAFSPQPPFSLVARSDLLCFGFPRGKEAEADPYAEPTQSKRLELYSQRFDCPNIHFVSGITQKVGDASKMIVAYGVNDCVSRMVEIDKRDFAKYLFTSQ